MENQKKKCTSCGELKELSDFLKVKRGKYGVGSWCAKCRSAYKKNWNSKNPDKFKKYYQDNKVKFSEYGKRSYRKNPGKRAEYNKKWKLSNYDYSILKIREWQIENHERILITRKVWAANNKERLHSYTNNYRAAKTKNGGKITQKDWIELCKKYGNKCLCCGSNDKKLTLDHVIPLSLGGTNTIKNAQPLCKSCNSSKGAKYIDYR